MCGYRYEAPYDEEINDRLCIGICTSYVCSNGRFKLNEDHKKKYHVTHDDYM